MRFKNSQEPEWLTETDVSVRCQVSLATLRRWRLLGKGPRFTKLGGTLVRYGAEEFAAWERSQRTGGGRPAEAVAR
jgi:predicted DNA-binding transcriptional regulator AlpA